MGTGARIIQNAFSPHPVTKALTDIKSVDGATRQSAKHQHQEAELDPLQPASPGKVDAAKAGCGHKRGNQEGRTCPPQAN
jgi:hypothetical protein